MAFDFERSNLTLGRWEIASMWWGGPRNQHTNNESITVTNYASPPLAIDMDGLDSPRHWLI